MVRVGGGFLPIDEYIRTYGNIEMSKVLEREGFETLAGQRGLGDFSDAPNTTRNRALGDDLVRKSGLDSILGKRVDTAHQTKLSVSPQVERDLRYFTES